MHFFRGQSIGYVFRSNSTGKRKEEKERNRVRKTEGEREKVHPLWDCRAYGTFFFFLKIDLLLGHLVK